MYFSRIRMTNASVDQIEYDSCVYELHQFIWKFFEGSNTRNFVYRTDRNASGICTFTVSSAPPKNINGWQVETKEYDPAISIGQKLRFSLRANPTVRRIEEGLPRDKKRHDVVMDLKRRQRSIDPSEKLTVTELWQKAGLDWIRSKSSMCGFNVIEDSLIVEGYRCHRFHKPRSIPSIQISTLDFRGCLHVTDPQLFKEYLFKGIGSAKGFGCGLMQVAR